MVFKDLTQKFLGKLNMKTISALIGLTILISSFGAIAQKKSGEKKIARIVGFWTVDKIFSGKQEVTTNPDARQSIEFRPDGTYVNRSTMPDSGAYRVNENHSTLYLESAVHESPTGEPKRIEEWSFRISGDKLTLQQKVADNQASSAHADQMRYIYVRAKNDEVTRR